MEICSVRESMAREGQKARIRGWVYRHRASKTAVFVIVRDQTGIIQCTFKPDSKNFSDAEKLLMESAVEVEGTVKKDERAPGGFEISAECLKTIHLAERFPITKDQSPEFLLDNRHLWVRSRQMTAMMQIKDTLLVSAREWFHSQSWTEVTPPILTSNACEGGSTLFELDYFGQKGYLSQSAQLYLEALIFSLGKVYSITPSFRAEKSRTRRHLAEYWHLEGESAFAGNEDNMKTQEQLISHICKRIAEKHSAELKELGRDPEDLLRIKPPFKRLEYESAIKTLQKKGIQIEWGADLGTDEERELTKDEKIPVFVTNYPKHIKAFYMRENPKDPRTVLNADLLAPEGYGEMVGGSERETDVGKLIERLEKESIPIKNYEWYIDLRKFGSVQHSGFGLGIERLIRWICKLEHINEAVPFPRTMNRIYP